MLIPSRHDLGPSARTPPGHHRDHAGRPGVAVHQSARHGHPGRHHLRHHRSLRASAHSHRQKPRHYHGAGHRLRPAKSARSPPMPRPWKAASPRHQLPCPSMIWPPLRPGTGALDHKPLSHASGRIHKTHQASECGVRAWVAVSSRPRTAGAAIPHLAGHHDSAGRVASRSARPRRGCPASARSGR